MQTCRVIKKFSNKPSILSLVQVCKPAQWNTSLYHLSCLSLNAISFTRQPLFSHTRISGPCAIIDSNILRACLMFCRYCMLLVVQQLPHYKNWTICFKFAHCLLLLLHVTVVKMSYPKKVMHSSVYNFGLDSGCIVQSAIFLHSSGCTALFFIKL